MAAVGEAVVLIPGFMGSRLIRPDPLQTIWLDPEWNLLHIQEAVDLLRLQGPDDQRLAADAVLESVPLGAFSPQIYTPLLNFLRDPSQAGYPAENIHTFAFDWRRSIADGAYELDSKLGRWANRYQTDHPFVLLAHSYGGLVAAHALFTGNHAPARTALLITFGTPYAGLVKTLKSLQDMDEISDLPIAPVHLQQLLGDWPSTYDLMPFRDRLLMVKDAAGRPVSTADARIKLTGFRQDLVNASKNRLRLHQVPLPDQLPASPDAVPLTPRPLPVPVRTIVGAGIDTPVRLRAKASGGVTVESDTEGDGTVPVVSALDVASAASLGRRVYPVPYGHHVSLVKDPVALAYLRTELRYGAAERYIVQLALRSPRLPIGGANEVILEVRDGEGGGLLDHVTASVEFSPKLRFTEESSAVPSEAAGRHYLRFNMPKQPTRLRVTIPGLPTNAQPAPLLIVPSA